jgi:hypothetical protein
VVEFVTPTGFSASPQDQGADDGLDSDASPTTGRTGTVTLASGQTDNSVDAGFFAPTADIDIEKFTNGQDADFAPGVIIPVPNVAPPVTWTYTVTNTGNLPLTNVVVTDDQEGAVCTIPSLAVGATQTCTLTGTTMRGAYTNMATVTGQPVDPNTNVPVGPPVTDMDPSNYTGVFINIEKVADKDTICPGETVEYTLTTRMLGGAPGVQLRGIYVVDNNLNDTLRVSRTEFVGGDLNNNGFIDFIDNNNDGKSDEEFVWKYSLVVNNNLTNIATDFAELWVQLPTGDQFISNVGNADNVTVIVDNSRCGTIGDFVFEDDNEVIKTFFNSKKKLRYL